MQENNKLSTLEEKRLALRELIVNAIGTETKLYYQPNVNTQMKYPCIIYTRKDISSERANNKRFISHESFDVQYISASSDNDVVYKLLDLPFAEFDRRFISDNMYHDVIKIHI